MSARFRMNKVGSIRSKIDGTWTEVGTTPVRIMPAGGMEKNEFYNAVVVTHQCLVPIGTVITEQQILVVEGIEYNIQRVDDAAGAGKHKVLEVKEIR